MASRKKGKKSKWQAVPLTDLLPETPGGMPAMPKISSWADDVDDDHVDMYSSRKPQEPVVLPTAPRAARGPGVDEENVPMNPPFMAYVSNLSYDVVEEDLVEFFADMQVSNMRLPKESNKLKGYGYVDFEDRQSLIDALAMTNASIKGRRVRIEVSNSNSDDRRGRLGMGRDYGRREYDDADRNSDWRSGPRDEPTSAEGDRFRSRQGGGFDRDRGERRDDRESSASDNRPGAWREARAPLPDLPDRSDRSGSGFGDRRGFRSDDKDREFSRFGDRGGRDGDRGGDRGGDRDGDRGGSSFGPRRNYGDREPREQRDSASDWGNRFAARPATSSDPPPGAEPPRTRVKLNLQPRTKPIETVVVPKDGDSEKAESGDDGPAPSAPAPAPVPAANIFGAAKPVDTTAREREIEERLAKTYAESKPKSEDGKGPKEGTWGRRNGEGRGDNDKERPRPAWRSDEERGRQVERSAPRQPGSGRSDQRNDSRGPPTSRSGGRDPRGPIKAGESRGPSERERKDRDREDGVPPMPKATDEQAPNFVASNKYSMLPEDADSDNSNN